MKRSGPPERRTPLRQQSARRAGEAAARRNVVALVRARDVRCQAARRVPELGCAGPLDVHELIQRSLWPKGYLDPDNCLLVCRAHHDWIDAHVAEAHELGLLRHSWER